MSRTKMKRELFFKPMFKSFAPQEGATESLTLLHEEIEAIFLMDYQGMYQEDAAKSMGVSRTTLSRIIKNARTKIATALVNGKALEITDEKQEFVIAFICDDKENFGSLALDASFIVILRFKKGSIQNLKVIPNPLSHSKLRPGTILPSLLQEENVNYFVSNKAGEGLKSSLLRRGIFVIKKEKISREELLLMAEEL